MPDIRVFSYGGGVQSTAALVLAAHGKIDYRTFLFANVGEDTEHPATLAYVRDVAMPFAAEYGIELVEISRGGLNPTLMTKIRRLESSLPIPVRMDRTGKPGRRSCTEEYKITPLAREMKRRGACVATPAIVGLGISFDELERMRSEVDPRIPWQRRQYPLVHMAITRQDCMRIIADAGIPVPPRSSCFFCPFHSGEEWRRLQRETPDLFDQACGLEELMIERRAKRGKGPVYFTDQGAREHATLRELHLHQQLTFESSATCDGGHCFT